MVIHFTRKQGLFVEIGLLYSQTRHSSCSSRAKVNKGTCNFLETPLTTTLPLLLQTFSVLQNNNHVENESIRDKLHEQPTSC